MRIALVTVNPTIGDLEGNTRLMISRLDEARAAGADFVVFPELAVCGYPPRDLLVREGFVDACARASRALGEGHTGGLTCVFGTPRAVEEGHPGAGTANSLVVYQDGRYAGFYDKRLLPTYDVFDEDRYFRPGSQAVVIEVPTRSGGSGRVGLTICEDLWRGHDAGFAARYKGEADPVAELVAGGADVIVSASASPFVLNKGERHRGILAHHARAHGKPVLSVNQLGGNDDLVFDGHRYVFDGSGVLRGGGAMFDDAIVVADVGAGGGLGTGQLLHDAADERLLFDALVLGVADYLRKCGFTQGAIIGLSGGIDSALTAALAVAALGPSKVLGVAMPGPYSSDHSRVDAHETARRLGVRCIEVPIGGPFDALAAVSNEAFATLGQAALGAKLPDVTEENLQSRARGTVLMTLSNRTGAMVLTTGNKSETAVGYATLYGDMNGGLAVLSDVNKQWVYRLSRWINVHWKGLSGLGHCTLPPIPERSISKAPSAELRPNQTDQDSLPPYEVLDRIIDLAIEGSRGPASIAAETGDDPALVERIVRMIDKAEYKRRQAAVGLKVTSVAFGAGRRMPIAQRWRAR